MEFYQVIQQRRSVRKYKSTPIEKEKLYRILESARLAPSACNLQPWYFIVVQDEKIRQGLAPAYHQAWFYQAPVIICACGEPACNWKRCDNKNYNDVDVAIAMDHLILAATAEGLGTCWIGAFNPDVVREVLHLPAGIEPVAMTPLGYPDETCPATKRKPMEEIVFWDGWQGAVPEKFQC